MGTNDASRVSYASIWSRWFSSKVALFVSLWRRLGGCAHGLHFGLHFGLLRLLTPTQRTSGSPANRQRLLTIDEGILLLTPSPESIVDEGINCHRHLKMGNRADAQLLSYCSPRLSGLCSKVSSPVSKDVTH